MRVATYDEVKRMSASNHGGCLGFRYLFRWMKACVEETMLLRRTTKRMRGAHSMKLHLASCTLPTVWHSVAQLLKAIMRPSASAHGQCHFST